MDEAKDKAKTKEDAENQCDACDEDDLRQRAGFKGRIRRFGSNQVQLMKTVKTYGWLNLISDGTAPPSTTPPNALLCALMVF